MDSGPSPEDNQAPESTSGGIMRERRFKLSRACDRCRRRRIKCDEGHPCQSCLNANSACTFEEPGKRTHPHKSKRASTLEDRMAHLENLIQSIPSNVFTLSQFDPSGSTINPASLLPLGVPPPALSIQPLINPSTHFRPFQGASTSSSEVSDNSNHPRSYLYLDDQGSTRWQGETSGLPLLDLLVERDNPATRTGSDWTDAGFTKDDDADVSNNAWFPDRKPTAVEINPAKMWKIITAAITPDLMDSLVQCFLSTTHYMMPFLHVPTFLADYGNPAKWGEPGFAAFILAVCCLASRHSDDPRVRSDPNDSFSAGAQWFELFSRLRTLPTSDRPTLYTVQSVLVAGIYAVGLGKLSRAFSLISEAITLSIDTGLHRTVSDYDHFDAVEQEVRKRTFWCVYGWDKQIGAVFGRPPMIRLRDCDVEEPHVVDDEYISTEGGIKDQPAGTESRIGGFVISTRLFVVMEAVLDAHPSKPFSTETSPFLARASATLSSRQRRSEDLREEESLLEEILKSIPPHWAHTQETMSSEDVIRITQAERIHSLGQFVAMVIHRWRFSVLASLVDPSHGGGEDSPSSNQGAGETYSTRSTLERQMKVCHVCALQIISSHLHMATRGLMTYFGVHVIHQLTQAGRTLVAILLECKTPETQQFIKSSLDALRSCVGLLRRFSGRYVCGLRSAELIEEVCRLSYITLGNATPNPSTTDVSRIHPPWLRPVRRKSSTMRSAAARSASSHSGQRSVSTHSGYDSSDSPLGGAETYVGYPPPESFDYSRVGRAPRPPSSYAGSSPEISMSHAYEGLSPRHPGLKHPYAGSSGVAGPSNPSSKFSQSGPMFASPRSHFGGQPSPRTYGAMNLDPMDRSIGVDQSDTDLMALLASGSPSSGPARFDHPFSMYNQHTPESFGNPVGHEGSPPTFGSPNFGGPIGGGLGGHPHTPTGGAGPGHLTYLGLAGGGMRRLGSSPSDSPV